MIHYTCDRCKRQIDPNEQTRCVVQIDIQSLAEEPVLFNDDDVDQLAILNETLDQIGGTDLDDDQNNDSHHGRYDLCTECHDYQLKNPLGREAMLTLGPSIN